MDSTAAPTTVYKAVCMEMSNSHLLKMDTNDNYSTANALKKIISSTCSNYLKNNSTSSTTSFDASIVGNVDNNEPLFPGMVRCSKNPKSPIIFFSFDTAENREAAKKVMEKLLKHRKQAYWKEVPVTDKDLQMTFRGAGGAAVNNKDDNNGTEKNNTNSNSNNDALSNKAAKRQTREGDARASNTAQWAAYPYPIQVSKKAQHCKSIIRQIGSGRLQRELSKVGGGVQQLLDGFSMIESPFLSGYRNHVNFTCGYDAKHRPVIGFVSGSLMDGHVAVEDVTGRWWKGGSNQSTAAVAAAANSNNNTSASSSSSSPHLIDMDGAPLVPPTTNVLSVAYAKAVMNVIEQFEAKHVFNGVAYTLTLLDKGTASTATTAANGNDNNCEEADENEVNNNDDGEPAAKRGPRAEEEEEKSATTTAVAITSSAADAAADATVIAHPFWRRVQIRHSTIGEVMVDLEVDPSTLPAEFVTLIREKLVEALLSVEKTFNGVEAEAEENAFLALRIEQRRLRDAIEKQNRLAAAAAAAAEKETDNVITTAASAAGVTEEDKDKPDHQRIVSEKTRPNPLIIPSAKLVSAQWHFHSGSTMCPHEAPRDTIYGVPTLVEQLCGQKFLLSPPSFFQVNTPTTEKMLDRVAEVAQLKPTTTLLDLCCGTGIIGICLAKHVKKIVGIEMVVSAIENAKVNAANNGVTAKTTYYAAKVEDALNQAMNSLTAEEKQDIVAIFDPPRAGMHPSVLCAVRSMPQIRRIVYISCDQQALVRDCPSLMKEQTKKFRGTPYVIEGSFGIDLFPHTPHVEMVAVLNKVTSEEMDKYYEKESKYRTKEVVSNDTAAPAADEEEKEANKDE